MLSVRAIAVRLAAVIILTVGFGTSVFEEFIPEYHDGDAASVTWVESSAPGDAPPAPSHPPDATHVCHCVHAHTLSVVETPVVVQSWLRGNRAQNGNATYPRSPALPHHLRPPIA